MLRLALVALLVMLLLGAATATSAFSAVGGRPVREATQTAGKAASAPGVARVDRDPERDSVETYKDLTKLLISLATGTLVLAPTLFGVLKSTRIVAWFSMYSSASLLVLSVICGIFTLSSLAGSQHTNEYNIDYFLTRVFAIPQWLSFVLGVVLFMVFVFRNLKQRGVDVEHFNIIVDVFVKKGLLTAEEKAELLSRLEKT